MNYIQALAAQLPGFEYDKQTGGIKFTGMDVKGYEDVLSFAPVITNHDVRDLAETMLNGAEGKTWNDFVNKANQDIARQLMQQNPELFTYMTMTDAQRRTEEGQAAYYTARQQLLTSELQTLEKIGQILPEATQVAQQLSSGSYGDQIAGISGFGSMVQSYG